MRSIRRFTCMVAVLVLLLCGPVLAGESTQNPKSLPSVGGNTPKAIKARRQTARPRFAPVGRMGFLDALDLVLSNLSVYRLY